MTLFQVINVLGFNELVRVAEKNDEDPVRVDGLRVKI